MAQEYYQALEHRRTNYNLSAASPLSDARLREIVEFCTRHTPSAFNSQNARVAILLGPHHQALWDIVLDALRKLTPEAAFPRTEAKVRAFQAGHGSLLFFEDMAAVAELQQQFPLYKDNFPTWSTQACGMLQHVIWTALCAEGLGASLQHYNPLIDEAVRERFGIDPHWKLVAQMPFGSPTRDPEPKEFIDISKRVMLFS